MELAEKVRLAPAVLAVARKVAVLARDIGGSLLKEGAGSRYSEKIVEAESDLDDVWFGVGHYEFPLAEQADEAAVCLTSEI